MFTNINDIFAIIWPAVSQACHDFARFYSSTAAARRIHRRALPFWPWPWRPGAWQRA